MLPVNIQELDFNITKEEFKKLPPMERKRFTQSIILQILKRNPNGITVKLIEAMTFFDARTIAKHLEYLVAIREAYKNDMGKTAIYFPNGRISHPISIEDIKIGDKYYSFSFIKNPFGEFLYIQEKNKDIYNVFTVEGGLIIQKEYIDEFRKILEDISKKVEINEP